MKDPVSDFNQALCNEKHENIEKEFKAVWARLKNYQTDLKAMNNKLWAILLMLTANLAAVVAWYIKSAG